MNSVKPRVHWHTHVLHIYKAISCGYTFGNNKWLQEKINKTTERAHICTPVINTSPKRANIHNGDIRIIILFSIGKSTTRILKKKVWQDWGIIKKTWYNMYNTTKCCRVVAAVGNGAPYNVVLSFFFSLALKVAWSERVDASYHSFNGVLFSFFITNTKKIPQVEFRQVPSFSWSQASFNRCTKSGEKRAHKKVYVLHLLRSSRVLSPE